MLNDKEIIQDFMDLDIADRFAKWSDSGVPPCKISTLLTERESVPYKMHLELVGLA